MLQLQVRQLQMSQLQMPELLALLDLLAPLESTELLAHPQWTTKDYAMHS